MSNRIENEPTISGTHTSTGPDNMTQDSNNPSATPSTLETQTIGSASANNESNDKSNSVGNDNSNNNANHNNHITDDHNNNYNRVDNNINNNDDININNNNNQLVVGPDGAIYRMVKPPMYDMAAAEQFANAQRVRNLGLASSANAMNMNPMGAAAAAVHHQSLLNFNMHPGFVPFPGTVNADGSSAMQPHPMQQQQHQMQQMGLVGGGGGGAELSMSSIGPFNHHGAGVPINGQNAIVVLDGTNGVMMQPMAGMQTIPTTTTTTQGTATGSAPAPTALADTTEGTSGTGTEGDGKRKVGDSTTTVASAGGVVVDDAIAKRMRLTPNLWPTVGHLVPLQHQQQQHPPPLRLGAVGQMPAASSSSSTGRSYSLYVESDERNLSQYQCMARKQIEIFEATSDDAGTNAQGRNRPIYLGQVGIRCRHCSKLPPKQRKTGSVYYPNRVSIMSKTFPYYWSLSHTQRNMISDSHMPLLPFYVLIRCQLDGVYQTAQKMTVGHLCKHCTMIPEEVREKLVFLKDQKSSDGGGKRYWADRVRSLGVIETPKDGLIFQIM